MTNTNPWFNSAQPLASSIPQGWATTLPEWAESPSFGTEQGSVVPPADQYAKLFLGSEPPKIDVFTGIGALGEGIGNAIRAFRGMSPAPTPTLNSIQRREEQAKEDAKFQKILEYIWGDKSTPSNSFSQYAQPAPLRVDSPMTFGLGSL